MGKLTEFFRKHRPLLRDHVTTRKEPTLVLLSATFDRLNIDHILTDLPFLELPRELRDHTYSLALLDVEAFVGNGVRRKLVKRKDSDILTRFKPGEGAVGLLFANRQIHAEMMEVLNRTICQDVTIMLHAVKEGDGSDLDYMDATMPIFPDGAKRLTVRVYIRETLDLDGGLRDVAFQRQMMDHAVYKHLVKLMRGRRTVTDVTVEWSELVAMGFERYFHVSELVLRDVVKAVESMEKVVRFCVTVRDANVVGTFMSVA